MVKSEHSNICEAERGVYEYGERYNSLHEMREDLLRCIKEGISALKVPRRDKTEAIIHALAPYLKENINKSLLRKTVAYIVNYPFMIFLTSKEV